MLCLFCIVALQLSLLWLNVCMCYERLTPILCEKKNYNSVAGILIHVSQVDPGLALCIEHQAHFTILAFGLAKYMSYSSILL